MENRFKRFLTLCLAALLVCTLGIIGYAEETVPPVDHECFRHGDVNGDGEVTSKDAIYVLYHSLFGNEAYPVAENRDCDFNEDTALDKSDAIYVLYGSLQNPDYPLK